jgi:hypothetical protein
MLNKPGQAESLSPADLPPGIRIGPAAIEAAAALVHEWEKSSEYDARPLVRRLLILVLGSGVSFDSE